MVSKSMLVGSLVLLVGISSVGCGLETPDLGSAGDSGESEESESTNEPELPGDTDEAPAGSAEDTSGDGETGTSGGDFGAESDGAGSEHGSSEDTGPAIVCVDDDYEDNDSIAFPGFWNGAYLGAMSCDDDLDAFQIDPELEAREFLLQQSTGTTAWDEDFAQLVFELTCGQSICDVDDSLAEWKSVSADACQCPRDERMFLSVYPGEVGNPEQGTRYALILPE